MAGCCTISSPLWPTARSIRVSRASCRHAQLSWARFLLKTKRQLQVHTWASSHHVPIASRLCVIATPSSAAPAAAKGTCATHDACSARKWRDKNGAGIVSAIYDAPARQRFSDAHS